MRHADIDRIMKYLRYAQRDGEADLLAAAFACPTRGAPSKAEAI